jgi:hypothetical protein
MSRVGRWCGALVVETDGAQVLVGNPKEPCEVGELASPWVLPLPNKVPLSGCVLRIDRENLPALLSERLLIARNGSVSERLWRLVTNRQSEGELCAQWLAEVPPQVWDVVRDSLLRCS